MHKSMCVGRQAERMSLHYLKRNSYAVIARNFRHGPHEIDIIARSGDLLIFIEVKARSSNAFGYPESMVSSKQQASIQLAAEAYLDQTQWDGPIRFDIISIERSARGHRLWHIEDAFY